MSEDVLTNVDDRFDATARLVFYHAWDARLIAALDFLNIRTWGDVANLSETMLLSCPGVGRQQVAWLQKKLAGVGLAFCGSGYLRKEEAAQIVGARVVTGVYFAQCAEFIKIGHASNIGKRIRDIAICNPHEVELVGVLPVSSVAEARALEHDMHRRFRACRHRLEWFHRSPELDAYLRRIQHVHG